MAEITASMVKELREKTGAGMMDAKKALTETNGDMNAAVDMLRAKGLAKAEKKSSRTAAEGLVGISISGNKGVVVEVNSETDFVARNDQFQEFVRKTTEAALKSGANDAEGLAKADLGGKTVQETLTNLIATIGENMTLRRVAQLSVGKGAVVGYVHNAISPGLGKIGVLVALESDSSNSELEALGKQLSMHIAAAFPKFLDVASVDLAVLEREKSVLREQAKESGKAPDIIEKMLEGRVRKFYEEIVLLEQVFVIDGETKINKLLEKSKAKLTGYARFQLGEGIEKEVEDFAAEVAKVVNG